MLAVGCKAASDGSTLVGKAVFVEVGTGRTRGDDCELDILEPSI